MAEITYERLTELLSYDASNGLFTWKRDVRGGVKAGQRAGTKHKDGRIYICIDCKRYFAHRLAWLYVNKSFPVHNIDHINGINSDNRIENLRDITQQGNTENIRKPKSTNKSGYLGVCWDKQRNLWIARVTKNGKAVYAGHYETPEHAHRAYLIIKRSIHEHCTI